ncbi:hypothetical protein SAICODRAFT_8793 [Saitoella complicata NRRL Y-17804]|uniref:C3H1-type domain-containing protein n=1 Tax=Saitoella complicata (strain BCRC 22490 / CBS 7301 / JCM 7358 / NBRC 10748 / NRRL Y-17804) TaxID=698492 RepID=A0A0E9NBI2_SAICN|nr:uncharacterized protein SAICODRAFT_8793 [Saitoella complicata NRRL Y-17804]ODQ51492.1 hypothetical protein SAICODRAFT_8793 [Saitoella complicata NRRL Y-17804]GAO47237.1 hypothetical protein G7K_1447-t1 [Saitoella complicata NRRL Y-17804]
MQPFIFDPPPPPPPKASGTVDQQQSLQNHPAAAAGEQDTSQRGRGRGRGGGRGAGQRGGGGGRGKGRVRGGNLDYGQPTAAASSDLLVAQQAATPNIPPMTLNSYYQGYTPDASILSNPYGQSPSSSITTAAPGLGYESAIYNADGYALSSTALFQFPSTTPTPTPAPPRPPNTSATHEPDDLDEEAASSTTLRASGVTIPGTTISLDTPEDIAAWIAERKKKWPSASRVAEKDAERQQMVEARKRKAEEEGVDGAGGGGGDEESGGGAKKARDERVCVFFQRGRCRKGRHCHYKHERGGQNPNPTSSGPNKGQGPNQSGGKVEAFRKGGRKSLYERLLEQDRERENGLLLQAICFLVDNGFTKN